MNKLPHFEVTFNGVGRAATVCFCDEDFVDSEQFLEDLKPHVTEALAPFIMCKQDEGTRAALKSEVMRVLAGLVYLGILVCDQDGLWCFERRCGICNHYTHRCICASAAGGWRR